MKRNQLKNLMVCLVPILTVSLFALLFFRPYSDDQAQAKSSKYSLFFWHTVNSGGNSNMSPDDTLICTVGQICGGVMEGGGYTMGVGWASEGSPPTKVEEDEDAGIPYAFSLSQNYPNPFNPATNIEFELPRSGPARIEVFNILGRKVRTLLDQHMRAGHKLVRWDGRDDQGQEVTSGIYFYRIQAGDLVQCKKMLLLK
jgi:hypothetical protein